MGTTASREVVRADAAGVHDPIIVASVPAGHPYVQSMTASPRAVLIADPPVAGAPPGVWWPPVVLDPRWIERHRDRAQLLHIHFGTESFPAGHMTAVISAAHRVGWPVVFTAHDLQHPQLDDQSAYAPQLAELITGADAVITLTEGAASVIRREWNRDAVVIAHPSVLARDAVVPRVRGAEELRIGVHLKDLRPNADGPGTVRTLLASAALLRGGGLPAVAEIRLHHSVRDEAARDEVRRLCAADPHTILIEHERLTDAELNVALGRLDAYVLPYRHGTHSGLLELCWDLGVPVAAPAVGFYAEQHQDGSVRSFAPGDARLLAAALEDVMARAPRPGTAERTALVAARRERRLRTDEAAVNAQIAVYRGLIDRMGS